MPLNDNVNLNENDIKGSNIELVRNPFIAIYLNNIQNNGSKDVSNFQFDIDNDELIPVNQDILYNDKVSDANSVYQYSNKIREVTNIRYVRSNSDIIPDNYRQNLIEFGADNDDAFLIPFDYILVTREDGTQFMIAEDFSNTHTESVFHKYSIIRYSGKLVPFNVDSIYSNGIDLGRILSGDAEYIDVFANQFLSEQRLNESLLSAYGSLDYQRVDETDHGGGYVGYIDSKTLEIKSSLEKNELLLFEKSVNEGGF